MKTKRFFYVGLFSGLLLLNSCVAEDDLFQTDPNVETTESFWQNGNDALLGVNAVYGSLLTDGTYMRSTPLLLDLKGDDSRSQSPWGSMYNVGRFNSSAADPAIYGWAYETYYQGIYRANQVLENVPGIEMEDEELKTRILGQAYFLRGLFLFHSVNLFKNVPIPTSTEIFHEQRTQEEGWEQVISDFKMAADMLPLNYDDVNGPDSGQKGRATKGAAWAYIGKAYLFNHEYEEAKEYFELVINSGIYSLVPNYSDNFTEANENNSESIFEVQFSREAGGGVDLGWGGAPAAAWGKTSARAITYAPRGFGWTDVQPTRTLFEEFMKEQTVNGEQDPRLNVTIAWNDPEGYQLYGQDFATYYANNPADLNALFVNKYQNSATRAEEFDWRSGINERIMRYADVLLMYAEVINELGDTQEAYRYVQMVRDRVNLPDLATVKPNMSQQEMFEQIAHERYLELALEGHRFDDIRRWGWLDTRLDWLQERDPEFETYIPGREYFPIPQFEVDNNPGTEQNPAY